MKSRVPLHSNLAEVVEGGRAMKGGMLARKTLVEARFVNRLRQEVLPDVDGHARSHYDRRSRSKER